MSAVDTLVYRNASPGCLRVLGVPTLLVNGGMAAAGIVLLSKGGTQAPVGILLVILGALGVAFGWILLFGKYTLVLDRQRRLAIRTWTALFPLKREETPLDGFRSVALFQTLVRTRYSWVVSYAIELRGSGKKLRLRGALDEAPAYASAIDVATYLGLPFEDGRRPVEALIAERPRPKVRRIVLICLGLFAAILAIAFTIAYLTSGTDKPSRPPPRGKRSEIPRDNAAPREDA